MAAILSRGEISDTFRHILASASNPILPYAKKQVEL